jgi:hypothetical protein
MRVISGAARISEPSGMAAAIEFVVSLGRLGAAWSPTQVHAYGAVGPTVVRLSSGKVLALNWARQRDGS